MITIRPQSDRTIDFRALRRALSREGVRTQRIHIIADGTMEGGAFRIDGWPDAHKLDGDLPDGHHRIRAAVRSNELELIS
jgi:hypothetical protein